MTSKDGKSQCENCAGEGCGRCSGTGSFVQCPGCGTDDNSTITKSANDYHCQGCGAVFNAAGVLQSVKETEWEARKRFTQKMPGHR